mmetsp:Transcript_6064/g.12596  ORF Transcript_6064/g.12596 Transcript_6064/m.12596 type:complete len:113 (+) Transcript_6064:106-444(+)
MKQDQKPSTQRNTYATLIALARIIVLNTSDGMSQAPGPMPTLKNAMYNANPNTANPSLERPPTKANDTRNKDIEQPNKETKNRGLRPFLSKRCPARTMTASLINPNTIKIPI